MTTRFHGLTFETDPGSVFTPRETTEQLVDAALERLGDGLRASPTSAPAPAPSRSRSRCVHRRSKSGRATRAQRRSTLASHNAESLGARVHLVQGDLLDGLPRNLDLIVANLPYLAPGTPGYDDEPAAAVFSTGDGLDHYRRLLAGAADHLRPTAGC